MEVLYLRSTDLLKLEEMVNQSIRDGWRPFLPLTVRGESLIQPMIMDSDTYLLDIETAQASAMYEIGSDV